MQLGSQSGWGITGTLAQAYADNLPAIGTTPPDDTTGTLQLTLNQFTLDGDLSNVMQTQTADAVADNALLIFLFSAADPANFEICTVISSALTSGLLVLHVRRGRYNTTPLSFVTGDIAWIIFKSDLVIYSNDNFDADATTGAAAVLRLQAESTKATADVSDPTVCPDIDFNFVAPYEPSVVWLRIEAGGAAITDFTTLYPLAPCSNSALMSDPSEAW